MEDIATCKLTIPTLDGGNSSDMTVDLNSLSTSKGRFLMSLEVEILKETMFKVGKRITQLLRSGL